ncbi:ATP-grasp domain-containing protein [Marinimicrobium sp. ABcell2]|uniref:carboxylate--amine ligase n=1 Tax=Marinimicrobium sp. ABcell2 TaxID=3069751 RepID=UPI0027B27734|nr:ATP-grasp domain-containing protein [Marinimicrobium sp. ABcell2]MDQ2076165.1 ATP-grasp domain-containing protein [Marinimicrobium sp. ABcell2]
MKVLVLDAEQRSALAVTRSLGSIPDVEVTTAGASPVALAGCSRFSMRYIQSPNPEREPEAYLTWLKGVVAQTPFSLVLPVTEITSQLLLMNSEHLEGVHLPFSPYSTLMKLADKGKLLDCAKSLNIPVPSSQWFSCAEELDPTTLHYPLVLKPCLSKIYAQGKWITTRVRILRSSDDLSRELEASPYLHTYPFMLQEFIPGKGAGIFCLYDHGEPVAFFAHRRLREKPPEGGVSVLSESAEVDPAMHDYSVKLLDSVKWHGVAMVEFRVSPDGVPYLMEVNTRFWGSLQLAVDAGVDFPKLLWGVEQRLPRGGYEGYRIGQRLRWFLGDVDGLYLYLKGHYALKEKLTRILQFCTPRLHYGRCEINRLGDMRPAWHELKLYLKHLSGR